MRLDVFTLIPEAFAWVPERRPVAAVLGSELDLRIFNYRDTTPLSAGQVDDEPYGGGPGMVLRVDVVAAAFDAVYGGVPEQRVVALTPAGRQLDQELVEELVAGARRSRSSPRASRGSTSASSTTCARTRSRSGRTSSRVARSRRSQSSTPSCGGFPGALTEGSGEVESFSHALDGGIEYPHYTRPAEFRGWSVPEVLLSGDHARIEGWRRERVRSVT